MSAEIKGGQPVAVFRLPLPVSAFAYITDFIERVYGTGDTTMQFGDLLHPEQITIVSPADGFGPIKRGGRRPKAPAEDDATVVSHSFEDGVMHITMEEAQDRILRIAEVCGMWFEQVGGVNYVELQLQAPDAEVPFVFTVQRREGLTPHQARELAEARVTGLEAELARLRGEETQ